MQDILKNPVAVFILAVLGILGAWVIGLDNWGVALSTKNLGSLLISLASVAGASMGHSILGTRDPDPKTIAAILTAYDVPEATQQTPIQGTAAARASEAVVSSSAKVVEAAAAESSAVAAAVKAQVEKKE